MSTEEDDWDKIGKEEIQASDESEGRRSHSLPGYGDIQTKHQMLNIVRPPPTSLHPRSVARNNNNNNNLDQISPTKKSSSDEGSDFSKSSGELSIGKSASIVARQARTINLEEENRVLKARITDLETNVRHVEIRDRVVDSGTQPNCQSRTSMNPTTDATQPKPTEPKTKTPETRTNASAPISASAKAHTTNLPQPTKQKQSQPSFMQNTASAAAKAKAKQPARQKPITGITGPDAEVQSWSNFHAGNKRAEMRQPATKQARPKSVTPQGTSKEHGESTSVKRKGTPNWSSSS
ncbi:hypothetical protein Q7P37_011250 [Cladosporium fusiforme]